MNDTLGHAVGDELLIEVTARLRRFAPEALVGRIGGSRFAVIVPASGTRTSPCSASGCVPQVEGGPSAVAGVATHLRLAVGCARSPEHGGDASTLLRRARQP